MFSPLGFHLQTYKWMQYPIQRFSKLRTRGQLIFFIILIAHYFFRLFFFRVLIDSLAVNPTVFKYCRRIFVFFVAFVRIAAVITRVYSIHHRISSLFCALYMQSICLKVNTPSYETTLPSIFSRILNSMIINKNLKNS